MIKIKRLLACSICMLAMQGVMAQGVDGITGATSQTVKLKQSSCANSENNPAKQLLERLTKLQKKGIMVGHQDDPVYGTTWKWDEGKSDVLQTIGDYPAVMGFDMGHLENDSKENLDGVPFDRMKREIVAQYERGGIITLSWHPDNPVNGENAWNFHGDVVKKILTDKKIQAKFDGWLKKVADFIGSLKTADGKRIPVIFRPWHEMNGNWFWWCANVCTPAEYNLLYTKTYHALTNEGCDNIVWAWSPNLGSEKTLDRFLERYPGDSFVDLIGIDFYEFDNNDKNYETKLQETLDVLMQATEKTGKIAALTETGCRGIAQKTDWFSNVLYPVVKDYDLSYILFWRNAWDNPKEAYLPGVGDTVAIKDFNKFKKQKTVLFLKDIRKIK